MPSQTKYAVPPPQETGLRVFVRSSYPSRYNFAVENYNAVSVGHKLTMRGGRLLLFRSVVAVAWIISLVFAIVALFKGAAVTGTLIIGIFYLALSIYNTYVFIQNRTVLNNSRLLLANVAGPTGGDHEWVTLPLDSRSANERLSAVDQTLIDSVRKEFVGTNNGAIDCLVYTRRYVSTYTTFPKELILHAVGFLVVIIIGIALATVRLV